MMRQLVVPRLDQLSEREIGRYISFYSYERNHIGLLVKYVIAEHTNYELASVPYKHNHCQIEILHAGFNIDVPICYTSLPKDTQIEVLQVELARML